VEALDEETPLVEARDATLSGSGYSTEQAAQAAGTRWRDIALVAFARLNIGVDFLEESTELAGGFSEYALAELAKQLGHPVANERPGLVVFQEPRPVFASTKAEAFVKPSMRRASGTFEAVRDLDDLHVAEQEHLAFRLYAASFSLEPSADARLLMSMMAIETLIEREVRSAGAGSLVDQLMDRVRQAGLPDNEAASLLGAMKDLKQESIGQAGKRLVSVLGERTYLGSSPAKFFTACYSLRSKLVHGSSDRPDRAVIDTHASVLHSMVGELLSRRVLHVTEEWLIERESNTGGAT
jgi:hypothetical protein